MTDKRNFLTRQQSNVNTSTNKRSNDERKWKSLTSTSSVNTDSLECWINSKSCETVTSPNKCDETQNRDAWRHKRSLPIGSLSRWTKKGGFLKSKMRKSASSKSNWTDTDWIDVTGSLRVQNRGGFRALRWFIKTHFLRKTRLTSYLMNRWMHQFSRRGHRIHHSRG